MSFGQLEMRFAETQEPTGRPPLLAPEVSHGLIIRSPWVEEILDGRKIWEIRGHATRIHGRIAIVRAGSKQVYGYCDLIDVHGPLTLSQMLEHCEEHRIPVEELQREGLPYPKTYAWHLANPTKLESPIPYDHPNGAVIWVLFDRPAE